MNASALHLLSAAAAGQEPPAWMQFAPFVLMIVVIWFFMLRPQMKRQKEHQAKIEGLKKGDMVLTGGGLLAKVIKVDDTYAELELGANVKVKALKSTITDVIPPVSGKPAND